MTRATGPSLAAAVLLLTGSLAMRGQAALPAGWESIAIGPNVAGSCSVQPNGVWMIQAGGTDIGGRGDTFRFTFARVTGDFTVTCRVLSQTNTHGEAKVGVMIRDGLGPGSRHCLLARMPDFGVDQQWREQLDQDTFRHGPYSYSGRLPVWLRLQRTGELIAAFGSRDGNHWEPVGRVLSLNMGSQVQAGIAVTSHNESQTGAAEVDQVAIGTEVVPLGPEGVQGVPGNHSALLTWQGLPGAQGYNIYRLNPGGRTKLNAQPLLAPFYIDTGDGAAGLPDDVSQRYVVTALFDRGESLASAPALVTPMLPLPGGFVGYEIRTLTPGGASLDSDGLLIVEGSGAGIEGSADQMYFLAAPIRGTAELTVRLLDRPVKSDEWAKAGLMIRGRPEASAENVLLAATPDHGLILQWRLRAGEETDGIEGDPLETYPLYLRIRRTGNRVLCYRSQDGVDFVQVGGTISLPNLGLAASIGFALAAHTQKSTTHAEFDHIQLK